MEKQIAENLPASPIGVTAITDPFSCAQTIRYVPEGITVADILRGLNIPEAHWGQAIVLFDGDVIRHEFWHLARPREGVRIVVRVLPAGDGNTFLRTFLTLAVIVVASQIVGPYAAGYTGLLTGSATAATAAGYIGIGATTAAGILAVNALVPTSQAKFDSGTDTSQTLSVGASLNELKPFATMPLIMGRHRTWPPYAAKPYTSIVGKDQYLSLLFVVGYKDLQITELKLGETDLSNYDEVEYEILCGGTTDKDQDGGTVTAITLFPASVDEVSPNQKLLGPASPVEQTTSLDTDEFSIDLTFPNGLISIDKSGNKRDIAVSVTVEYAPTGGSYSTLATITTSASSPETIRKGYRYKFPSRGQYDVRVTRTSIDLDPTGTQDGTGSAQTWQDDVYLSTFRSIANENPVLHPDAALIALRIKATDQLNGIVSNFNVVASSILPDYDSGTGAWITRETNNPASLFRAVLEGVANARPLQTTSTVTALDGTPIPLLGGGLWLQGGQSRTDLDDLEDWHTECVTEGRAFNMVRDFASTVWDTLHDVAAAGMGRPRHINGLWSVVRDIEQTVPKQHFTPRNSWGFSGSKNYIQMPHAFRIRFLNEAEGYQNDEMLVYDDGYSASNASLFETLEITGVTNADQIWKAGRYHIAVARLRPEVFTFQCDIEQLAVTQGDLIRKSNDSILVGLGSARLKAVTDNGTHATSIDLDDAMPMATGVSYIVRVRHSIDGSSSVHAVDTVAGEQTSLTFTTPILLASAPAVGDLVMFGETDLEGMDLLVDSIIPGVDMSATLKCYDAAPGIYRADEGTIPEFDSHITQPPGAVVPVIEAVISDESALVREQDGTLSVRILLSFGFLNNRASVTNIEVQYRLYGYDWWSQLPLLQGDALSASIFDVRENLEYEIRARYRFLDTTVGEWSAALRHVVVGKTTPPQDVELFFVERQPDGTREFSWVLNDPAPDIAGFRIKYRLSHTGADWDTNMTDLSDGAGLIQRSPWETNQLAAGDYTICIKAVDTGGRESANVKCVFSTLGDPRIQNALIVQNENRIGFPGTKNFCFVESDTTYLVPDGTGTWDGLAAETWDSWDAWNYLPVASMEYITEEIDVGGVVSFDPIVNVTAGGSVVIEEQHNDGGGYTSFTALAGTITARYIKIKVTITTPDLDGITNMQTILSADTIEEEIIDWATSGDGAPVGDFRLPITKAFSLITTVQIALQNVGANWTWEVIDKSPSLGPHVKIWDNTGLSASPPTPGIPSLADATIDAVIKGL